MYLKSSENCQFHIWINPTDIFAYKNFFSEFITQILKSSENVQEEVYERLKEIKFSLSNEYIGWAVFLQLDHLRNNLDDLIKVYSEFTLFPFRIKFKNSELLQDIDAVRQIFKKPKEFIRSDIPKECVFKEN